jgi:hypothetical protein
MRNIRVSIDNRTLKLRFNSDTGSNYNFMKLAMDTGSFVSGASSTTNVEFGYANSSTTASTLGQLSLRIPLYASTTYNKSCYFFGGSVNPSGQQRMMGQANYASTSAITSITVFPDAGTWDAGDILIYGVK